MDQWWPMPWFPIFPFFFMLACFIVFLVVMGPMMGRWRDRRDGPSSPQRTALDILDERFASGEIDKAEYDEKRRIISLGK